MAASAQTAATALGRVLVHPKIFEFNLLSLVHHPAGSRTANASPRSAKNGTCSFDEWRLRLGQSHHCLSPPRAFYILETYGSYQLSKNARPTYLQRTTRDIRRLLGGENLSVRDGARGGECGNHRVD